MSAASLPPSQQNQPIVVRDHGSFQRGFFLAILVALVAYACLFAKLWQGSQAEEIEASLNSLAASENQTRLLLAIARAEEINLAGAEYIKNCGEELAKQAWREAGVPQQRYQLLTSFIAFSPGELADYMPEEFEIVLWDDLTEVNRERKVDLLAAGVTVEY